MNIRNTQPKNYTLEALRSLSAIMNPPGHWEYDEDAREYHYSLSERSVRDELINSADRVNDFSEYLHILGSCKVENLAPGSFILKYSEEDILKSPLVNKEIKALKAPDIVKEILRREKGSIKRIANALPRVLNKLCKGVVSKETPDFVSVKWTADDNNVLFLNYVVTGEERVRANNQMLESICSKVGMNVKDDFTHASAKAGDKEYVQIMRVEEEGLKSLFNSYAVVSELQKELNKKPSNILPLVTGIGGGVMLGVGIATGGLALAIAGGIVMLGSFIKAIWNCCAGPRPRFFRPPVEGVDGSEDLHDNAFSPAPA